MPSSSKGPLALRLGLVVLLVALGTLCLHRAARGRYDFNHFYLDARYVWQHGALNPDLQPIEPDTPAADARRQLPFYLPVVPLALAPLGALGIQSAALWWAAAQVAAAGLSLRILWRWATEAPRARPGTAYAVALALALPAFYEAARFNQLSFFVLALVLGSAHLLERDRPKSAGLLLAGAAVLKLLPGLFLVWLLLKRRWSAAVSMVVTGAVLTVVPPLIAFGPQRAIEYHRQWWTHNVGGDSAAGLVNAQLVNHFIDHRNQSLQQVLARLTWPGHPFHTAWQPVHLEQHTAVRIGTILAGMLLLGLIWRTRQPWSRLVPMERRGEAAVYLVAINALSPLVRQYYLVWAVPALVLLALHADNSDARVRRCTWTGLAIWLIGMLLWMWPPARLWGAHLLMLIAVGLLLLLALGYARRASVNSVISGRQLNRI